MTRETVALKADPNFVMAQASALADAFKGLPRDVQRELSSLLDSDGAGSLFNVDSLPADGTGALVVRVAFGDWYPGVLAAARARDVEGLSHLIASEALKIGASNAGSVSPAGSGVESA